MNKVLKFFTRAYSFVYVRTLRRSTYMRELSQTLKDCESVLDVGCGSSSQLSHLNRHFYTVGIDAFAPNIEKSKQDHVHNECYVMDALDMDKHFAPNSFDCVMAIEIIEHLTKEDGLKMLKMMEKIARKKIIIFTPNGFVNQDDYDGNVWQIHKSGWTAREMRQLGFKVTGSRGWKALRGELCTLKYRPYFFWNTVSDITQLVVQFTPSLAYQIFCVKDK